LDLTHPLVMELSAELRALDALPIVTKKEREDWSVARRDFEKKLRTVWSSIYDLLPHKIEHDLADADIRAKDEGYARHQRKLLADLLDPGARGPNKTPVPTPASVTPPSGAADL
jgi:hypothetical protein